MDDKIREKLIYEAMIATKAAYAPYSKFHVGAAVLTMSGKIYKGANIENASYPAGICAERVAITSAVVDGEVNKNKPILAIAIVGGKENGNGNGSGDSGTDSDKDGGGFGDGGGFNDGDSGDNIIIDINDYCPPCGICRQVMREFADPKSFIIILAKNMKEYKEYTLDELLPESFGPENLN